MSKTCKLIAENDISVEVLENHDNPTNAKTFYNPVMRVNREFVLTCLGAYCNERKGNTNCLDAFGATGMVGLQWKRHLKFPASITVNDIDEVCAESIKANCERNGFMSQDFQITSKSVVGDGESEVPLVDNIVTISQEDANVLMHRTQFNFIHVDPFGSTVQYLDALFRNVFHRGMVVITSTDVAALYGKCPQVTKRNYSAYTVRTDYTKEMAVRILLAEAARAAAKCNKGFDVMYCVAVEHFVQVGLKIKRGANHSNQCVSQISSYLHCLHCQEWAQLPDTYSPIEQPYSLLPCSCKTEYPGHTAVIVGPMWNGEIYSTDFVRQMSEKAVEYKLSERTQSLLNTIICESQCLSTATVGVTGFGDQVRTNEKHESSKKNKKDEQTGKKDENVEVSNPKTSGGNCRDSKSICDTSSGMEVDKDKDNSGGSNKSEHSVSEVDTGSCMKTVDLADWKIQSHQQEKRVLSVDDSTQLVATKKRKTVRMYSDSQMPLFYYSLHKRRFKAVDVPKIVKLITQLHKEGFRASRTSFDTHGLRTNATLAELTGVLQQHFKQKIQ